MGLGKSVGSGLGDADRQGSSLERGTCISLDWLAGFATVNIGGGVRKMPMLGAGPAVGDQVWVANLAGQPVCLGPLPKAAVGTIQSAPAAGKVTVKGDDGLLSTLPYNDAVTFAAQQRVAIDWDSQSIAYKLASDAPVVVPVVPDPVVAGPQQQTREFAPTGSGSYFASTGSWTKDDVWCSDSLIGCYFYAGIADTIPDNAVINAVRIALTETQNSYPSSLATLGTHGLTGRTGAPAVSGAVAVPGGSGTKDLPTSFGDALKIGAARGIGTNRGGLHRFATASAGSGRLFITYTV